MTRAELRTAVLQALGDPAGETYAAADVHQALDYGQLVYAALTLAIVRTGAVWLDDLEHYYALLPRLADWIAPLRVRHEAAPAGAMWDGFEWDEKLWAEIENEGNVTRTRLRPESLAGMAAADQAWETATGTARKYGLAGADGLVLDRAINGTIARLLLMYAAAPQALDADGAAPEIPAEDHGELVKFAVWWFRLADGGAPLAAAAKGLDEFLAACNRRAGVLLAHYRSLGYDTIPHEVKP